MFVLIRPLFHRIGPRVSQDRTFSKTNAPILTKHCVSLVLLGKEGSGQVNHTLGEETDSASQCITSIQVVLDTIDDCKIGKRKKIRIKGVLLLRVAVRACRFQMTREASSWTDPELVALMQEDSVEVVELDQCMHGLTKTDEIETAPAQKGTRLLTNMQAAHVVLSKCCNHEQTQVQLKSNIAQVTREYPAIDDCAELIFWEMRTGSADVQARTRIW